MTKKMISKCVKTSRSHISSCSFEEMIDELKDMMDEHAIATEGKVLEKDMLFSLDSEPDLYEDTCHPLLVIQNNVIFEETDFEYEQRLRHEKRREEYDLKELERLSKKYNKK